MSPGPTWSGRFEDDFEAEVLSLTSSITVDKRLTPQEVSATRAHAQGLVRASLLTNDEFEAISRTLDEILSDYEEGSFPPETEEDIHSAIENRLTEELGDIGAKIHAGRSRNDLVVTDLRLWLKQAIVDAARELSRLCSVLLDAARSHVDALAPGFTHLQLAQPVLLSHLILAHFFAFARDFQRLVQAYGRTDVSCLGAGAFAGTSLAIDPPALAEQLGFGDVFSNSADAVSARDFALEFLGTAAILGTNLSRLAEEIVLWSSPQFRFVELSDAYATGSSIMPQKKNPDVAELVRARSSRLTARLTQLLGVMKGLPLTYNRDLQEDKEPIFDAADTLLGSLRLMSGTVSTLEFNLARLEYAADDPLALATDFAEALVGKGVPFRKAHELVGEAVASSVKGGRDLREVVKGQMSKQLDTDWVDALDARASVASRKSHGGTAPERVKEQLQDASELLAAQAAWLDSRTSP